jgi:hypothetical protein
MTVNLAAYAAAHPQPAWSLGTVPGEKAYDSDPFDVVAYHGGWVVADAAANSLLQVSASGQIHLLARFPAVTETAPARVFGPNPVTVKAQAVPTSVAVGPDGALYVGLLRGVPSKPGTAYIYRVVPGHQAKIWARGLTVTKLPVAGLFQPTGLAVGSRGGIYVSNYGDSLATAAHPGEILKITGL